MPAPDPTAYADSLAFLISQVGAHSAQEFRRRIAAFGISPRAFAILSNLEARGLQTQQELGDALGVHRNTMVGLIDGMEEAGWVERRRSATDRRAFEIHVTPSGRRIVRKVAAVVEAIDEELGRSLSDRDRATLGRLLSRIAEGLELPRAVHISLTERG